MNGAHTVFSTIGVQVAFLARMAMLFVLVASIAVTVPREADAGGRPRISASYALSGGTIRIQGSNFRDNARVRITLIDRSQGPGYEVTRELTTRANKRGAFTATSTGWCPRTVEIVATDVGRGTTARDVLENSDCPW
jgi:hypothetical protein